jgi:hypothetical protein
MNRPGYSGEAILESGRYGWLTTGLTLEPAGDEGSR